MTNVMVRINRAPRSDDEGGFTLLEIVIAMTIISSTFVMLAHAMAGGMAALSAARQRSVFVELANAEVEAMRAIAWESLGVSTLDAARNTAYPTDLHEGRSAALIDVAAIQAADPDFITPPPAVSVVTTSPVSGVITPYTVRRWITWSDAGGSDSTTDLKHIEIKIEWDESGRGARSVSLESIRYPGGLGETDATNSAPVATAAVSPSTGQAQVQTFSFSGSDSTDPDLDVLTHAWQFGDGATSALADATHEYLVAGTYNAVHTVTDPSGVTNSRSVAVTVTDPPAGAPPVASFTADPTAGIAPLSVNLDAGASSDPEGGVLSYRWTFGDGEPNGTGVGATHVYSTVGSYTITLRVTDQTGLFSESSIVVTTTPLNCTITSASFKNPSSNATANDIVVDSSNKPASNGFSFTAATNTACTSVSAVLPLSSGFLTVTLNYTDTGGVRTWTGATSVGSSVRFNRANAQSGVFNASDSASFPITFDVHA